MTQDQNNIRQNFKCFIHLPVLFFATDIKIQKSYRNQGIWSYSCGKPRDWCSLGKENWKNLLYYMYKLIYLIIMEDALVDQKKEVDGNIN